jgi:hypothetical protein
VVVQDETEFAAPMLHEGEVADASAMGGSIPIPYHIRKEIISPEWSDSGLKKILRIWLRGRGADRISRLPGRSVGGAGAKKKTTLFGVVLNL